MYYLIGDWSAVFRLGLASVGSVVCGLWLVGVCDLAGGMCEWYGG